MGVVHHGSYLAWFEVGRVELMRSRGFPYRAMEDSGISFPVIEARLRYIKPARFDERLTVTCWCSAVSKTRFTVSYHVTRGDDVIAHGYTAHAALKRSGRPTALPSAFREALESDIATDENPPETKWTNAKRSTEREALHSGKRG